MTDQTKQPETPECQRLSDVQTESNIIGEFLDWLTYDKQYEICERYATTEAYLPVHETTNKLLAEYFEINLDKVEKERRELLEWLRNKK